MDTILLAKNASADSVSFGNLKTLDNGGKTVYVSYNGAPLVVQTPQMVATFGSSRWNPAGPNAPADPSKDKHSVELSFKGHETNPAMAAFHRLLSGMDDRNVEAGLENSNAWFKKKYNSKDVVAALYTPMLRRSKNKETGEPDDRYPPTVRLSLPCGADGNFTCPIYGRDKQPVALSAIEKGSRVTAIIQCVGLWIAGGKFGCTWKIVQLWVVPPESIRGFAFRDDGSGPAAAAAGVARLSLSEGDEEDEQAIMDAADAETGGSGSGASAAGGVPATEMVADSEDEDDDPIDKPLKKRDA